MPLSSACLCVCVYKWNTIHKVFIGCVMQTSQNNPSPQGLFCLVSSSFVIVRAKNLRSKKFGPPFGLRPKSGHLYLYAYLILKNKKNLSSFSRSLHHHSFLMGFSFLGQSSLTLTLLNLSLELQNFYECHHLCHGLAAQARSVVAHVWACGPPFIFLKRTIGAHYNHIFKLSNLLSIFYMS